jgi:predicted membrane channel-forming protein YqfA (hemolysin III family)
VGPGTSSDILVIVYVVIAATLAIAATGFAMHRKGRLQGRRAGLALAVACVLPIIVGVIIYVWKVPA